MCTPNSRRRYASPPSSSYPALSSGCLPTAASPSLCIPLALSPSLPSPYILPVDVAMWIADVGRKGGRERTWASSEPEKEGEGRNGCSQRGGGCTSRRSAVSRVGDRHISRQRNHRREHNGIMQQSKSHYLVNVIQSDKIVWFVLCIKPLLPA